ARSRRYSTIVAPAGGSSEARGIGTYVCPNAMVKSAPCLHETHESRAIGMIAARRDVSYPARVGGSRLNCALDFARTLITQLPARLQSVGPWSRRAAYDACLSALDFLHGLHVEQDGAISMRE